MSGILLLCVVAALLLAFVNGANDNAKGVATLIGGRTMGLRPAIALAAAATLVGSIAAFWLAGALMARFSGKGIVDTAIVTQMAFAVSIAIAAGVTVLIATLIGMPISTTHAIVGSIVGVGFASGGLHLATPGKVFFLLLLVSPMLAVGVAAAMYLIARAARRQFGVGDQTCLCIGQSVEPVSITAGGTMVMQSTGITLSAGEAEQCKTRYTGNVVGVEAQRVLDVSHVFSATALSFARGLNDTPKIAAILIAGSVLSNNTAGRGVALGLTGIAILLGGIFAVRRVARTMSYRIADFNDGQGFIANVTTAALVISASWHGMPVSTTHVSCGSLFGIGAVNGRANWPMIAKIVLAWVITLPVAGVIGYVSWQVLA